MISLRELQSRVNAWTIKNRLDGPAHQPLLGVVEEVGELSHAYLKSEQGIRGDAAEHEAAGQDAVGDIVVYLAGFCARMGWDLQEIVDKVWPEVEKRDWISHPKNGIDA